MIIIQNKRSKTASSQSYRAKTIKHPKIPSKISKKGRKRSFPKKYLSKTKKKNKLSISSNTCQKWSIFFKKRLKTIISQKNLSKMVIFLKKNGSKRSFPKNTSKMIFFLKKTARNGHCPKIGQKRSISKKSGRKRPVPKSTGQKRKKTSTKTVKNIQKKVENDHFQKKYPSKTKTISFLKHL